MPLKRKYFYFFNIKKKERRPQIIMYKQIKISFNNFVIKFFNLRGDFAYFFSFLMPTYEYICKDCGDRFEHFQTMSSPPLKEHPDCEKEGSNVERVISGGTGLIFKGSGF